MGRSQNSRNRVFVEEGEGIRTQAFDPSKLEDPSLIIYAPVRVLGNDTIVTNGEEGLRPSNTIYDICYKCDELGDPLINDHHAVALGVVTYDELKRIYDMTAKINEVLTGLFDRMNITLVDFKIEFGRTSDGQIVLADEVSPDTCRLWDKTTNEKLDKDRFRRDLGRVREAYEEILARLEALKK